MREHFRAPASYRVVRQDAHNIVLEFETRSLTANV